MHVDLASVAQLQEEMAKCVRKGYADDEKVTYTYCNFKEFKKYKITVEIMADAVFVDTKGRKWKMLQGS